MKRISKKTLGVVFNNLAFLVEAGIDTLTAVTILSDTKDKHIKDITKILIKELSDGNGLGIAIKHNERFFGAGYSEYVEAGIKSGKLAEVLARLAKSITSSDKMRKQVKNVMIYPAFLMIVTVCASYYMFTSIVPQMAVNIKELTGVELPLLTRYVMQISDYLIENKFTILLFLTAIIICGKFACNLFKDSIAKIKIGMPIIGNIIAESELTEYYSSLSRLLEAGIPMSEALTICNKGLKNAYLKSCFVKQGEIQQSRGKSLREIMEKLPCVSSLECQCIAVAEKTGKLPIVLDMISEQKQMDLHSKIKTLLSLLEPTILLIMGGVVGIIVLSVYLPMFSMSGF